MCQLWNLVPAWNHLMFQPLLDMTFAVDGAATGWMHPTVHHPTFLFTFKSGAIWETPISLSTAITKRKTHGKHKEIDAREKNMQMLRSEAQSKPGCSCCAANCRTAVPRRNTCGPAVSLHSHCLCSFQEIDRRDDYSAALSNVTPRPFVTRHIWPGCCSSLRDQGWSLWSLRCEGGKLVLWVLSNKKWPFFNLLSFCSNPFISFIHHLTLSCWQGQ